MKIVLKPIFEKNFSIAVDNNVVVVKGFVNLFNPQPLLGTFLTDLHNDLLYYGYRFVTVDFCELKFINSSSIRMFLVWLMKIVKLPIDDRYEIIMYIKKDDVLQFNLTKSFRLINTSLRIVEN